MRRVIFTIVSNNYLHFARTLMQSVAINEPACDRFCVLVDEDGSRAEALHAEFSLLRFDELRIPDRRCFAFQYSILELNTAVKPWAFAHLFERGYDEVVYLDPDISLYAALRLVFARLGSDADVVLTPHLLAPMTDEHSPSELDIRRAGTYNLGFCAMRHTANTLAVLDWWQAKLRDRCVIDFDAGIFVDQSWMDLVPGLFPRIGIVRDPGYNVAYWNLAQRPLACNDGEWSVDEWPLVFFHFSGIDPLDPTPFSRYQNRFVFDTLGDARTLVADYVERVLSNGAATVRTSPYAFAFFDDRTTVVTDALRRLYRNDEALRSRLGEDPFAQPSILSTAMPAGAGRCLAPTYAMQALWNERPELRQAFPMADDDSTAHYYDWFVHRGLHAYAPHVVEAHAAILAPIAQAFHLPDDAAAPETLQAQSERKSREHVVERLFVTILGREVDPQTRRHLANRLCDRAGPWRVLKGVGLSPESRSRKALMSRLMRGARQMLGHLISGTEAPSFAVPKAAMGHLVKPGLPSHVGPDLDATALQGRHKAGNVLPGSCK